MTATNLPTIDLDSTLTWDGIYDAIATLGLEQNIVELDRDGITTITPEQSGITPEFTARVRDRVLELCEQITGAPFSVDDTPTRPVIPGNLFLIAQLLAYDIPEFLEVFMNPAMQTLVAAILGPGRRLSSYSGFVKWATPLPEGQERHELTGLHADSPSTTGFVANNPPLVCNTNFLVTDYGSMEDGPMVIAPGSHREQRVPQPFDTPRMEGAFAPAGSIFVFSGALQHGSIARINPGLRLSVNAYFCQPYVVAQEHLKDQLPRISALGKLARQLVWDDSPYGWGRNGAPYMPTPFADGLPEDGYGILDPASFRR